MKTPHPGWAEQDPEDWWRASAKAIRAVVRKKGGKKRTVDAVGLTGQMHTSVFLDRHNDVIRPALLWCDGRTTSQCQSIVEQVGLENLRSWVSNPALEGFTLPKILWLRDVEPQAFRRLSKVLLPKDYIRFRLTGDMATEPSDAAGTLLFDVAARRWSDEMFQALSLAPGLVPEVGESAGVLGRINAAAAKAIGIEAGIPVVGGGADNACGAISVGAVSPGSVVASWGTSGTVLAPSSTPIIDPQLRAHTFCHAVPDTWYVMGVMLSAGSAFAWHSDQLARELPENGRALRLNREAAGIAPGADGVTFLPYLQGERTPHRDADARAVFAGLSLAHTRAHMTRAVLEGICFGLRDCLSIIEELGLAVPQVLLTGGGARVPFLRKLQSDVFGKKVVPVENSEGPAFGAALLAAVGAKAFPNVKVAAGKTLRHGSAEAPDRRVHREFDEPYARFRRLYPALRDALKQPPAATK